MLEPLLALAFLSGVAAVAVATAAAGRSGGDAECCAAAAAAEEERRDFAASHHVRKVVSHCLSGQRKKSLWVLRLCRRFAHHSLCQALIAFGRHGGMICSEVNLFLIAAALRTWIGCTIAWPLPLRRCHRTEQRERAAGWTRVKAVSLSWSAP